MKLNLIIIFTIFVAPYAFACEKSTMDELSYMDKKSLIKHACSSYEDISAYNKKLEEIMDITNEQHIQYIKYMKYDDGSYTHRNLLNSIKDSYDLSQKHGYEVLAKSNSCLNNYTNALNFIKKEHGIRASFWQKLIEFDNSNYLNNLFEKDTRSDSVIFLERYCNNPV